MLAFLLGLAWLLNVGPGAPAPLCFWWLFCQVRRLGLPSGENRAEYTELASHMTQVTLKMAESMAAKVMVWSGKPLRTHSTVSSCSSPSCRQGLLVACGDVTLAIVNVQNLSEHRVGPSRVEDRSPAQGNRGSFPLQKSPTSFNIHFTLAIHS